MANEVELERMVVRLTGDGTGYHNMLRRAQEATTSATQRIGAQLRRVGTIMTATVTAPVIAAGVGLVKVASDAEETESKFRAIFRDIPQEAERMANELDKSYGLSSVGARKLLSDTADLLTGFGFTQKAALDLSSDVQKLAVDLASFQNVQQERASQALTKALLGERESAKLLGIAILEKDVKERIAILRTQGMTFETERQAKAFATLRLAQEQSKNAVGDYARTNQQFANSWRELTADLQDTAVEFGRELLPLMSKGLGIVREVVDRIKNLTSEQRRLVLIIAGAAAAIGPLLLGIGALIPLLGLAMVAFKGIAVVIAALTSPFAIITGLVVGLGVAIVNHLELAGKVVHWFGSQWTRLVERVRPVIDTIVKLVRAGQINLAWRFAFAQLKLIWLENTRELARIWTKFQSFYIDTVDFFAEAMLELRAMFDSSFDLEGAEAALRDMNKSSNRRLIDQFTNRMGAVTKEVEGLQAEIDKLDLDIKVEDDPMPELQERLAEVDKAAKINVKFSTGGIDAIAADSVEALARIGEAKFEAIERRRGAPQANEEEKKQTAVLEDIRDLLQGEGAVLATVPVGLT